MGMTGAADHLQTLTLDQLIELLEEAQLHHPETVVAAWAELEKRGIPLQEILNRRRALAGRMEMHKRVPRPWVGSVAPSAEGPDVRRMASDWLDVGPVSTEAILSALTILMGLLACLQLYGLFFSGLILLRPADSVDGFTLYITLIGCGAAVVCLLAALRLWQRRRVGWVLSFAFLLFQWLTPVSDLIRYALLGTTDVFAARTDPSPLHHAITLFAVGSLLYGPGLYLLLRVRVRKVFDVRQGAALRTGLVACAVLVAFKLLLFGG
ncbi:hypothetical protein CLV84_2146 [Neolewinella xylanilytica]|uniref:Uncharacterized protein n=1 Tax=Neolewinella xylanilytica TaxID=1514080 RepID=A0A2S6I256_9BACT|nr:hypothetical protein [Neolewinella xylanilytica]PPK85254.1 hypothetical protein CLV84_2146 [Neolewinella xylanilytica]